MKSKNIDITKDSSSKSTSVSGMLKSPVPGPSNKQTSTVQTTSNPNNDDPCSINSCQIPSQFQESDETTVNNRTELFYGNTCGEKH